VNKFIIIIMREMSLEIASDTLNIIGYAYSITGIALTIPIVFVFRQYFRVLDFVQFMYVFWAVLASQRIFSEYLKIGFAQFDSNISIFS
jgi:hypothetical protein